MEMVIINCKAIKFDEITVTSQPNKPKTPAVEITEIKQTKINQLIYETKTIYHAAPARRDARVCPEHRRERSGG